MVKKPVSILIADDDEEDLELFEEVILTIEPSAKLDKVSNGMAVIEYLDGTKDKDLPGLIVLDYSMPKLNGCQVLLKIAQVPRFKDITMVVLSTSNAPAHIHECKSNGATEYFVKPNSIRELNVIAKRMLTLLSR